MRLGRDAVGSVTRERPRRGDGEFHRGMFGGTALGGRLRVCTEGRLRVCAEGRLRVCAERVGREDVRASSKFSTGSDEGEGGWESDGDDMEE